MAETLGSLVDKLTIKSIRQQTLQKMIEAKEAKFSKGDLGEKLELVIKQIGALNEEIDTYLTKAFAGEVPLRDEKIKLYNKPEIIGKIGEVSKVSEAIEGLAQKNWELWQLEDEARREDVSLEYIGEVKRKIDVVNQSRNDFIDRIDLLFEEKIKSQK